MKKRLRKKRHIGEYQELGVSLFIGFSPKITDCEQNQFLDDLIDFIESIDLEFGGLTEKYTAEYYITCQSYKKPLTKQTLEIIDEWLSNNWLVWSYHFSDFSDAWWD